MSEGSDLTLWVSDQIGHAVPDGDLSKMDALAVTAKIKAYAGVTCILIAAAHEKRAHKALGYSSWEEYVGAEFDISKSRSYQLISQAKFVLELAEETSTIVDLSEWEVRELAPAKDEAMAAAAGAAEQAEAEDADDAEKERRIREALDGVRQAQHDHHKAEQERAARARHTTTTTETTTVEFDPETGEVLGSESEVPPSPPMPAKDPALVMQARLSDHRKRVADWLAFDRHDEVIDAMTVEQREDYRSFVLSVFNHANATLDYIGGSVRLKAVES